MKKSLLVFISLLVIHFALTFSVGLLVLYLFPPSQSFSANVTDVDSLLKHHSLLSVSVLLFAGVIIEETLFRLIPALVLTALKKQNNRAWIFVFYFISSVLFGMAHGNWENIFVQGIGGVVYSVTFVYFWKKKNIYGENDLENGLIASVLLHFLFDFIMIFIL